TGCSTRGADTSALPPAGRIHPRATGCVATTAAAPRYADTSRHCRSRRPRQATAPPTRRDRPRSGLHRQASFRLPHGHVITPPPTLPSSEITVRATAALSKPRIAMLRQIRDPLGRRRMSDRARHVYRRGSEGPVAPSTISDTTARCLGACPTVDLF